jgi:site-specific recombinase XerD
MPSFQSLSNMETPQPPRLLDQVRHVIRLKHYSLKTEKSYIRYIRDFIRFHNKKHPQEMGVAEIRQYLTHLAVAQHVAASTQTMQKFLGIRM